MIKLKINVISIFFIVFKELSRQSQYQNELKGIIYIKFIGTIRYQSDSKATNKELYQMSSQQKHQKDEEVELSQLFAGYSDQNDWMLQDDQNLTFDYKKLEEIQIESLRKVKNSDSSSVRKLQITPGKDLSIEQKEEIEKTLAQKFITKGFGYKVNMKSVLKKHKIAINAEYYNNTMSSIVRRTFRAIQNFLLNECKQENIKRINHYEGSLLRSPMLQCTKWLKKEELDTFYKFVCRRYNLKKVCISQDQASRLYGQIIQSARKDHEVSHIILHRTKKKSDTKNSQGFIFSYAPSCTIAKNISNNQDIHITNKFVQN